MSGDSFTIEGPVEANALTAATTATIAREPWVDSYILQYSAADGKLHRGASAPARGHHPLGWMSLRRFAPSRNAPSGRSSPRRSSR